MCGKVFENAETFAEQILANAETLDSHGRNESSVMRALFFLPRAGVREGRRRSEQADAGFRRPPAVPPSTPPGEHRPGPVSPQKGK